MDRIGKKKREIEEIVSYVEAIKDEDGYAVVDVNLQNGATLYDPLCVDGNRDLDGGIYDYIDRQTNLIPEKIPLKIRFHGEVPEDEQDAIKAAMRRHYTAASYDLLWDVAANLRKMVVLTILGVVLLGLYFYFAYATDAFFAEILSILGSFSLWEAADALLLERPHLRREQKYLEQNSNAVIEFVPPDGATAQADAPADTTETNA